MRLSRWLVLCFAVSLGVAPAARAAEYVVTDGTDLFFGFDDGAVYRITDTGEVETIAAGLPLTSPAGVLLYNDGKDGQEFIVSDVGLLFGGPGDGALFLVGDGLPITTIFAGPPLTSPYGLLLKGSTLYVSDFGDGDPDVLDGAVYAVELDPDGDREPGPFPLSPDAIRTVWSGEPLQGPNQMVSMAGSRVLLADDSGSLFELDLREPKDGALPEPPIELTGDLGDPVGLVKLGGRLVAVDAAGQIVTSMDKKGEKRQTVLLGVAGVDQFLTADGVSQRGGYVAVANCKDLFSFDTDGEILGIGLGSEPFVEVIHSGDPLVNPMGVLILK